MAGSRGRHKKVRIAALVYCGELCSSCTNQCREATPDNRPLIMECPVCRGYGCNQCSGGKITLSGCPQSLLDGRFKREINRVTFAMNDKLLPRSGGIGEQSARFVSLWRMFASDVSLIETEKAKSG